MSETLEQPKVFSIEKLDAAQLPELQGLKEKQLQIVKENPFVAITDNATFEAAKKARTTLKTARTDIEKQDKTIASKIKKFREMVANIHGDLISITKPHEEKQQEEVDRWEAIKEAEKAEKQRIEEERISKIQQSIVDIINNAYAKIDSLTFERIESLKVDFEQNLYKTDVSQFQEFELDFNERLNFIKSQFAAKEKQLNDLEAQRLENIRLEAERKKLEAEREELEKAKKEAEAKAEADRKAIEDQQKAEQAKIDEARRELEAEKERIAKQEADKKAAELRAAIEAEKEEKAAEEAKMKAERAEALKPEKEKAVDFLNCLVFKNDLPKITDPQIAELIQTFIHKVDAQRNDLITLINNL